MEQRGADEKKGKALLCSLAPFSPISCLKLRRYADETDTGRHFARKQYQKFKMHLTVMPSKESSANLQHKHHSEQEGVEK